VLENGKQRIGARRAWPSTPRREAHARRLTRRRHLIAQLVPAPNRLGRLDPAVAAGRGYVGEVLAVEIQANQARFIDPSEPLHWRRTPR